MAAEAPVEVSSSKHSTSRVVLVPRHVRRHSWSSAVVNEDELITDGAAAANGAWFAGPQGINWPAFGSGIGLVVVGLVRNASTMAPIFLAVGVLSIGLGVLVPALAALLRRASDGRCVGLPLDTTHGLVRDLVERYEAAHRLADRRGAPDMADHSFDLIAAAAARLDGEPPIFEGQLDVIRRAIRDLDDVIAALGLVGPGHGSLLANPLLDRPAQ